MVGEGDLDDAARILTRVGDGEAGAPRAVVAGAPSVSPGPQVATAGEPQRGRRCGDEHAVGRGGGDVVGDARVEQAGVEAPGDDVGVGEQEAAEIDVGHDAADVRLRQGRVEASQGGRAVGAVSDDLAQHRVEVAADDRADAQPRVDAHPGARRLGQRDDLAARG